MARKVADGLNKKQARTRPMHLMQNDPNWDSGKKKAPSTLSHLFQELIHNPAIRYAVGGIATAVLSQLATDTKDKYPEISHFLKDNVSSFEGRLDQYRDRFQNQKEAQT